LLDARLRSTTRSARMRSIGRVTNALGTLGWMLVATEAGLAAEPWRDEGACGQRLGAPVETPREKCISAYCIATSLERVCSCLAGDGDRLEIVREKAVAAPLR
jgi:hypothetical protein